jgi:MSHA biogenesis protein MshI
VYLFKKKLRGDRRCALVMDAEGIAVASIDGSNANRPSLESCRYDAFAPGQDNAAVLKKTIAETHLDKLACSTLLGVDEYKLLMVEAPEVPPAELKAAIRWRIRDLIDFHIDDAVLDVFDVPPSGARGVQEHLYVVVSRSALVKERVETLQAAGVNLEVIDIPELAMRNLAARLEQDAKGQAMLYFRADQGLITLTRDSTLYLARSMDIGYQQLLESPELVDRLALELQRSMDYYDRHFQQAPINHVTLCPLPQPIPQLPDQLAQQTGITVRELRLDDIVETSTPVDDTLFARCLLALGAALRSEPAQL